MIYGITNGYLGNCYTTAILVANNDKEAIDKASDILKASAEKGSLYKEDYWDRENLNIDFKVDESEGIVID